VHGVTVNSKGSVVQLPINPGPIISRAEAISNARGNVMTTTKDVVPFDGVAKLSSWTEVSALIDASSDPRDGAYTAPPPGLAAVPWSPVWAVVLKTLTSLGGSYGDPRVDWFLVVMNATSGSVRLETQTSSTPAFPSWFSALSDRDPTLKGCPGGSSARLPFGVLTRNEEAYVVHPGHGPGTKAILMLTTVPALNRADPGLYGGCVRENCSHDDLVWLTILVYTAAPGHTLTCGSTYGPPDAHPKQMKEMFTLDVPDHDELGCSPVPAALANLKDLAPPAG
jgi:hypothetical protein